MLVGKKFESWIVHTELDHHPTRLPALLRQYLRSDLHVAPRAGRQMGEENAARLCCRSEGVEFGGDLGDVFCYHSF